MIRLILLSFKYFIRNKKNYINALIIGIIISLTVFVSTFYTTIINFLNFDINKDFQSRTLLVIKKDNTISLTDIREELEKINHIDGVFSVTSRYNGLISKEFEKNGLSGRVDLYAANNKTLPTIIKGTDFPNKSGNYIICPINFYPSDSDFTKVTKNNFYNIEKYLNKDINFEYKNFKTNKVDVIKYKLIGIYENNPLSIDENVCFVNESSLLKVYIAERNGLENFNLEDQRSFYIQVDNYNNLDLVKQSLNEQNFESISTTYIDYSSYNKIFKRIKTVSITLIVIIFLFLLIILYKQNTKNKKDYYILHSIGYNRMIINCIDFFYKIFLLLLSYIFSIIVILIGLIFLKIIQYYKPLIFGKKMIVIDIKFWLISIVLTLSVVLFLFIIKLFQQRNCFK